MSGEHWYSREGAPAYEVPTADGKRMRSTTIADARKLGLCPSVTTVLAVLAKPQLEVWKVKQGILAALTLGRIDGESDDAYLSRVMADSQQQVKDAADEGSRIHNAIEDHFHGRRVPASYEPHVEAVLAKLHELYPGVNDWVAERSFASPDGYGGKVDLHSPSTGLTGDHKGKDGDFSDGKKLAYDQHWQLAPYMRGLGFDFGEGFNLFVSRTHPGKVAPHVWSAADMAKGWAVFAAALELWKCVRGYDPRFNSGE